MVQLSQLHGSEREGEQLSGKTPRIRHNMVSFRSSAPGGSRIKLNTEVTANGPDAMATPRSLQGQTRDAFVKLRHVPSQALQLPPRSLKNTRVLPPLDNTEESLRTLQKLVGSDTSHSKTMSVVAIRRSGMRVFEFPSSGSAPQKLIAGDRYDAAAANLLNPEPSRQRDADESSPLDRCRSFVLSHGGLQQDELGQEGIRKRQFCLPRHSEAAAVWSRPIHVYGEGAGGAPNDFADSLAFDSKFESGNLLSAHRIGVLEYELLLQPDHATTGHTQWYLFSVANMVAGSTYRFHITNLNKPDSLYGAGQLPLFFSSHAFKRDGRGWHRVGKDVKYVKNGRKRNGRPLFTLSFTLEFPHDNDKCLLAHCFPYTYTDLKQYLENQKQLVRSRFVFDCDSLCQTLAGNVCHVLTITASGRADEVAKRKGVFISARVHPGESNSSLIMKGILDFLTGSSAEAVLLRSSYVFKIIPMLNPDGVVNGHYRCNLAGYDLNRHWHWPNSKAHPTILCAKELLRELAKEREVDMFVDIHGHSVKHNLFAYGVPGDGDQKEFIQVLQSVSPHFSLRDSKFSVEKSKDHTGRVVAWREFEIQKSYTLEASFCGVGDGKTSRSHFAASDFELMGAAFGVALAEHCSKTQRGPDGVSLLDRDSSIRRLLSDLNTDLQIGDATDASQADTARLSEEESARASTASDSATGPQGAEKMGSSGAAELDATARRRSEEEEEGESSSDDEDRIADVEGGSEEGVGGSEEEGGGAEQEASPLSGHGTHPLPAGAAARHAQARGGEGGGRGAGGGYSCIPFPPTSEEAGEADGRRLVCWQHAAPRRRLHPPKTPRDSPSAPRRPEEAQAPAKPRDAPAGAAGGVEAGTGGAGGPGGAGGAGGGPMEVGWSYLPRARPSPRPSKAGPGPAAPLPPQLGSPRHVTPQTYPKEAKAGPHSPPPPPTYCPPPPRANFYPFPAQRRARATGAGGGGVLLRSTATEAYTGPPGMFVGGRWQQSAKPVGPSSKFLPLMLGAVPAS